MSTLRQRRVKWPFIQAFTLVEVVSVLGVLALLAAMVLPALSVARKAGCTSMTQSRFAAVELACHLYYADHGTWPAFVDTSGVFELSGQSEVFLQALDGSQGSVRYLDWNDDWLSEDAGTNVLIDGFGNPDWVLVFDLDGDGRISGESLQGYPDPPEEVHRRVAIYSRNAGNLRDFQWVANWE